MATVKEETIMLPFFEGSDITADQKEQLKRRFLQHFLYLESGEQEKLGTFYDDMEMRYEEAEPRDALPGQPRERYFAHVRRVMLIPIQINIEAPLDWIVGWGGHDLEEETPYTNDWFEDRYGKFSASIARALTIPGKTPDVSITPSMRKLYYDRVGNAEAHIILPVKIGFVADHFDALTTIYCLSPERQARKRWEVGTYCVPWLLEDIAREFKDQARRWGDNIALAFSTMDQANAQG
ncbi:MAG TPA: hypothetical protein VJH55_00405 [Candidatus Paceibacterota bacterium]